MYDHRLRTLIVLMETKNYTKTAERLFITQPAVTHHIKSLEKNSGIKLFDNNKTFALSKEGKLIYEYAIKVMRLNKQLNLAIENIRLGSGTNSFAVTNQIMSSYFKTSLSNLLKNSKRKFSIKVCCMDDIIDEVCEGKCEFGIVDTSMEGERFINKLLYRTRIVLLVGKTHPLNHKIAVNAEDLVDETIFVDNRCSGLRRLLEQELVKNNHDLQTLGKLFEINDISMIIDSVKKGLGLGFVYESAVTEELKKGELKIIDLPELDLFQSFYLIANKESLTPDDADKIAMEIVKAYRNENANV